MSYLDFHATDAERARVSELIKEDVIANGPAIHDLLVSCYTASGEDGRPEDVHETRMSDGSCRCGYHKRVRWDVTITQDDGPGIVHTFAWGVRRSSAYARCVKIIEDPFWDGWSVTLADAPTYIPVRPV